MTGNEIIVFLLQAFLYSASPGPDQPRGPPSGDSADREAYRRGPAPGMEPKGGAGSDFRPEFVSFHCLCHRTKATFAVMFLLNLSNCF